MPRDFAAPGTRGCSRAGSRPPDPFPGIRPACSISRGRDLNGSLLVSVERSKLLRVRKALFHCGRAHVGIVRATPLAGGTRMRLVIAMDPESMSILEDAILSAVGGD